MKVTFRSSNSIVLSFNESEMVRVTNLFPTTALSKIEVFGIEDTLIIPSLNITIKSSKFNYPFPRPIKVVIKKQKPLTSTTPAALAQAA